LRAGQRPAKEIRGIIVDDLPSASSSFGQQPDGTSMPSPTSSIMPDLPTTPPRPAPPPKDQSIAPVTTPSNVRLSRSVENFSRPTRSPAFGVDISPISERPGEGDRFSVSALPSTPPSPLSWAEATNDTLTNIVAREEPAPPTHILDKPLPLPPTVVHAVSTADDSARPLRIAPLPNPPRSAFAAAEEHTDTQRPLSGEQRPASAHRASLRHMQTFPSAKAARRRSQSSGEMTLGPAFAGLGFLSPTTPATPNRPRHTRRTSIGIKKIDIDDWEDAIEYSWDHPPDADEEFDGRHQLSHVASFDSMPPRGALPALPPPPSQRPPPLPLTPVMEQTTAESQTELVSPTRGHDERASRYPSLQGLGIETFRSPTVLNIDRDDGTERDEARESLQIPLQIPPRRRDPGSPISKSSSQESIILSIASSIMGTHRSSNSSTSLGDIDHFTSVEDEGVVDSTHGQQARQGSDSSQETVTTEPHSVVAPLAESVLTPVSEFPSTKLPPVVESYPRRPSASRVQVPNRTSSIIGGKFPAPPASRSRSNTLNGRPKNVRVSYSLFPTNTPQPPTPSS
jgi:hypothetical protein